MDIDMNEQDKDKLNRKLAEWAGWKRHVPAYKLNWEAPDKHWCESPPDFTESLDACFRWLVPKAIDEIMAEQECSSDVAYGILFKKWLQELELVIPKAAFALCLAFEKLIDIGGE